MKKVLLGTVVSCFVLGSSAGITLADEKRSADELAVEGISKLMDALRLFVDAIPQYSTPEILENGDIIIRRKNKKEMEEQEEKENDVEETAT